TWLVVLLLAILFLPVLIFGGIFGFAILSSWFSSLAADQEVTQIHELASEHPGIQEYTTWVAISLGVLGSDVDLVITGTPDQEPDEIRELLIPFFALMSETGTHLDYSQEYGGAPFELIRANPKFETAEEIPFTELFEELARGASRVTL